MRVLSIPLTFCLALVMSCTSEETELLEVFEPKPITTVEILLTGDAKNNELFSFRDLTVL
jgi:hypothetical protein